MSLDIEVEANVQIEADIEVETQVEIQPEFETQVESKPEVEIEIQAEVGVELEIPVPEVELKTGVQDIQIDAELVVDSNIEEPMVEAELGGNTSNDIKSHTTISHSLKKWIYLVSALIFTLCFIINFWLFIERCLLYEDYKATPQNKDIDTFIVECLIFISLWLILVVLFWHCFAKERKLELAETTVIQGDIEINGTAPVNVELIEGESEIVIDLNRPTLELKAEVMVDAQQITEDEPNYEVEVEMPEIEARVNLPDGEINAEATIEIEVG